jgi:hypothetical protein
MLARMDSQLEKMEACLVKTETTDLEAIQEEIEFEVEREEGPKEDAAVKPVRTLKKRHGDGISL